MADDETKKQTGPALWKPVTPMGASGAQATDTASTTEDETEDSPFADVETELRTRYELLPEDVQQALMDTGYQTKLFEIAKAQKLTYEELGILERETTMVLLGMTRPAEYRDEIQVVLKKNDPETDAIVKAVNEQVFAPIRTSLEKVYAPITPETVATPVVPTPQSSTLTTKDVQIPTFSAPEPTSISSAEKTVLENTGITLSETPTPIKSPIAPTSFQTRSDMISAIENPSKTPTGSIISDKLTTAGSALAPKTTDYSLPKTGTVTQGPAPIDKSGSDPYREPIK